MTSAERPRARVGLVLLLSMCCLVLGSTGGAVAGSLITGKDVKNGSLTGKDVKDRTLGTGDLSGDGVAALRGLAGPAGPPGAPGQNGYQFVEGTTISLLAEQTTSVTIACPAGTTVLGGGVHGNSTARGTLLSGGPADFDEWTVNLVNPTDTMITGITPYATCTRP